jgi:hypothetical protein
LSLDALAMTVSALSIGGGDGGGQQVAADEGSHKKQMRPRSGPPPCTPCAALEVSVMGSLRAFNSVPCDSSMD